MVRKTMMVSYDEEMKLIRVVEEDYRDEVDLHRNLYHNGEVCSLTNLQDGKTKMISSLKPEKYETIMINWG